MTANPDDFNYITLAQAARIAGLSPNTLKVLARNHRLKTVKLGRDLFTRQEWLEEYLDSRRQFVAPGRKRRKQHSNSRENSSAVSDARQEEASTASEEPAAAKAAKCESPDSVLDTNAPEGTPLGESLPGASQSSKGDPPEDEISQGAVPTVDLIAASEEVPSVQPSSQVSGIMQGYRVEGLDGIFATTHEALRAMGVPDEDIKKRKYWHRLDRLPKAYQQRIQRVAA